METKRQKTGFFRDFSSLRPDKSAFSF